MTDLTYANSMIKADCDSCMAICCVAPGFERSEEFGLTKQAQAPCPHLSRGNACQIHDDLVKRGFPGCAQFDCKGAGQYITTHMFPHQTWRSSEDVKARISAAYRRLRVIFDLLELFDLSGKLPLSDEQEAARHSMMSRLDPLPHWDEARLAQAEIDGIFSEARKVLRSFRTAL